MSHQRWLAISVGLVLARRSAERICARLSSTSSASKRGRGQRQPQILERLVAIFRQRAQRAAQRVTVGAEIQLDRLALEPFVEGLGIEVADAVVERRGGEIGGPCLAGRVLRGAAGEGEVDGDQRHGRLVHQPGLDAARAHHALDGGRRGRSRGRDHRQQRDRDRDRGAVDGLRQGARDCVHECFSSGLRSWGLRLWTR